MRAAWIGLVFMEHARGSHELQEGGGTVPRYNSPPGTAAWSAGRGIFDSRLRPHAWMEKWTTRTLARMRYISAIHARCRAIARKLSDSKRFILANRCPWN